MIRKKKYIAAEFKIPSSMLSAILIIGNLMNLLFFAAVTVQFVDYGNTESVDNNSVWAMEPQFATLPIQAFSCSLAGVQPVGDSWPVANSTELDLQFDAETLECTVLQSTDEESKYLVKLSKQGEDLAQKIIEAGFAIASSEELLHNMVKLSKQGEVITQKIIDAGFAIVSPEGKSFHRQVHTSLTRSLRLVLPSQVLKTELSPNMVKLSKQGEVITHKIIEAGFAIASSKELSPNMVKLSKQGEVITHKIIEAGFAIASSKGEAEQARRGHHSKDH
ncbi:hypothetical protein J6590_079757 [Homalodisca vitripennis]|nr:hypothetical protein J6590_079757 [Homalodisca vitripennis]